MSLQEEQIGFGVLWPAPDTPILTARTLPPAGLTPAFSALSRHATSAQAPCHGAREPGGVPISAPVTCELGGTASPLTPVRTLPPTRNSAAAPDLLPAARAALAAASAVPAAAACSALTAACNSAVVAKLPALRSAAPAAALIPLTKPGRSPIHPKKAIKALSTGPSLLHQCFVWPPFASTISRGRTLSANSTWPKAELHGRAWMRLQFPRSTT